MEKVKLLIKDGANVNAKDQFYGWSPLDYAAQMGEFYFRLNFYLIGKVSKSQKKIILFFQGFEKIAEVLIKNGAEIDKQSNFLATPLFLAAANGNLKMLFLFLLNFNR